MEYTEHAGYRYYVEQIYMSWKKYNWAMTLSDQEYKYLNVIGKIRWRQSPSITHKDDMLSYILI